MEVDLDSVPLIMATAASLGVLGALLNTAHGWLAQYRPPSKHRLVRFAPAVYRSFGSVMGGIPSMFFCHAKWF